MSKVHRTYPLIIAHRGFSDEAPENTRAAFQKAIDAHCDMIEFDIRLSSDNVPVVFHDRRLQRTSNGKGNVNTKSSVELTDIDNGSWFSPKFRRERIPLLADILLLARSGMKLNIEIKPDVTSTNGQSPVEIVLQEIRDANVESSVVLTSFNHLMIKEAKEINPRLVTGVIYNPITHFRRSPSTLVKNAKADFFVCSKIQINNDVVSDSHDAGFPLYVYGVQTGRDIERMLKFEVDGLICNNPSFVRETVDLLLRK